MWLRRTLILVLVAGCFSYSYVFAGCTADCRTAFYLTDQGGSCERFRYSTDLTPAFHAWNVLKTYNTVNTETQPANTTGNKIKIYFMTKTGGGACFRTCGANEQPQEVTPGNNFTEKFNFETDQRKCSGKGS